MKPLVIEQAEAIVPAILVAGSSVDAPTEGVKRHRPDVARLARRPAGTSMRIGLGCIASRQARKPSAPKVLPPGRIRAAPLSRGTPLPGKPSACGCDVSSHAGLQCKPGRHGIVGCFQDRDHVVLSHGQVEGPEAAAHFLQRLLGRIEPLRQFAYVANALTVQFISVCRSPRLFLPVQERRLRGPARRAPLRFTRQPIMDPAWSPTIGECWSPAGRRLGNSLSPCSSTSCTPFLSDLRRRRPVPQNGRPG